MPGALAGVPVAAVLGFVSVLIMMTQLEPTAVKLGIILSVAGVVFGGVMTYRSRRTTTS